jgi:CRP-like cAMP-binding protein
MNIVALVNHFSKHINLTEKEVELLGLMLRYHTLKKKEYIVKEGEICLYNSFIVKGCIKISQIDDEGKEHVLAFAIENWWAVDMYSFIGQLPAVYSLQALEDTELIQFTKKQYDLKYEVIPKLNKFTRIMLENSYVAHQKRIMQNISLNVEDRYLLFKEKYPNLESRISQKYVASYLGITPEFLSRLKNKLIQKERK